MKKRVVLMIIACLVISMSIWGIGTQQPQGATGEKAVWPTSRNVEIICPILPTSNVDALGRIMVAYFNKTYPGTNFYMVNDAGGAGTVGFERIRNAKPDGSYFGWDSCELMACYGDGSYAYSLDDFTVIHDFWMPAPSLIIAVRADSRYKTFQDFIDDAKARPNRVSTPCGQGFMFNITAGYEEDFGVTFRKVDGASNGERIASLLGGMTDFVPLSPATVEQYVESGDMRLLAYIGNERTEYFPDLPCTAELGYPKKTINFEGHFTMVGPKGIDENIANAISEALRGFSEDEFSREAIFNIRKGYPSYTSRAEGIKTLYEIQDFFVSVNKKYSGN